MADHSTYQWHLFVDESGDYDALDADVVIAAVGLRVGRVLARPDQLGTQLRRLVPGLPWPLHLCVMRRPSALALAPMALRIRAVAQVATKERRALESALQAIEAGQVGRTEDLQRIATRLGGVAESGLAVPVNEVLAAHAADWRRLLEATDALAEAPAALWADSGVFATPPSFKAQIAAAQHLLQSTPEAATRVARAIARGDEPAWEDLTELDRLLHDFSSAWALLGRKREVIAAFARILNTLAQPDESGLPGAVVFVAGESMIGDFCPPGDGRDRYLSLLESLLTRVAEACARWPGIHEVEIRVCNRYIVDPLVASCRRQVILTPGHIDHLLQQIEQQVGPKVRLIPRDTPRYADTRDPGFVFADFAANSCRLLLGDRNLPAVEDDVRSTVGVIPRSGDPSKTHVQAAGAAWRLLEALRSCEKPPNSPMRPWAREQALEWGQS